MPPKRKSKLESGKEVDSTGRPEIEHDATLLVPTPSTLCSEVIESALLRYPSHVEQLVSKSGSKLQELDEWRLHKFSDLVRSRKPAYLDKEELQKLMEWKLTRGKFRPTLPALVAQNTQQRVKSCTQEAFLALDSFKNLPKGEDSTPEAHKSFRALVKTLCAGLKGVGPATASLILSIYDDIVPFMSDESYLWAIYADDEARSGKRGKREIKYTEKGYFDYALRIWEMGERLGRMPSEVEQVGWVLGREWISGRMLKPEAEPSLSAETQTQGVIEVLDPTSKRRKTCDPAPNSRVIHHTTFLSAPIEEPRPAYMKRRHDFLVEPGPSSIGSCDTGALVLDDLLDKATRQIPKRRRVVGPDAWNGLSRQDSTLRDIQNLSHRSTIVSSRLPTPTYFHPCNKNEPVAPPKSSSPLTRASLSRPTTESRLMLLQDLGSERNTEPFPFTLPPGRSPLEAAPSIKSSTSQSIPRCSPPSRFISQGIPVRTRQLQSFHNNHPTSQTQEFDSDSDEEDINEKDEIADEEVEGERKEDSARDSVERELVESRYASINKLLGNLFLSRHRSPP